MEAPRYRRTGPVPVDPATGRKKTTWEVTDRARAMVKDLPTSTFIGRPDACTQARKCIRREGHDGDHYPT